MIFPYQARWILELESPTMANFRPSQAARGEEWCVGREIVCVSLSTIDPPPNVRFALNLQIYVTL